MSRVVITVDRYCERDGIPLSNIFTVP